MDEETKVSELKAAVQKFCEDRDWDQYHSPKELAIGVTTEASELLDIFRFKSDKEIIAMLEDPAKRADISDELADVFYFVLRFSQMYNVDLSTALRSKIEKVDKRYPLDKAKGSNKKYNELG